VNRAALLALAAVSFVGCGSDRATPVKTALERETPKQKPKPRPWPSLPHCPSTAGNCATARGTVIYVEAVDPDGDGDAHFILASEQSITAPGITVLDIEKELRPHPLPGIGARLAAAGPVYRGSHDQKQIQATVLRVGR
jgi:hypothetical protein